MAKVLLRFGPKWDSSLFAAFAVELDLAAVARLNVAYASGDYFRNAGASVVEKQEKEPITTSGSRLIGRVQ